MREAFYVRGFRCFLFLFVLLGFVSLCFVDVYGTRMFIGRGYRGEKLILYGFKRYGKYKGGFCDRSILVFLRVVRLEFSFKE